MNRTVSFKNILSAALVIFLSLVFTIPLAAGEESSEQIAYDAYLYAYPLVLMDVTMRQMTNVTAPDPNHGRAPINQFSHAQTFPPVEFKAVARPTFDTLYSTAWLDLSSEPIILSVPDTNGRYYLMEMLDMWSDVFDAPGFRTTGTGPGNFAITGPQWKGKLPKDVTELHAPTPFVWVIGRTQTNGGQDYEAVHAIQNMYLLTPLSRWVNPHRRPKPAPPVDPNVDNKTAPIIQVEQMDGLTFFTRFSEVLKKNPPHANDYPILHRMKAIGIEPGKDFTPPQGIDPSVFDQAAKSALDYMKNNQGGIATLVNGWSMMIENMGAYGTSYLRRAMIALIGLGANLPEDAIYPGVFIDSSGNPLLGSNPYILHFAQDELPPADAFWSLTLYDKDGFAVPNSINRYAISNHDPLHYNDDGSLDIYIQSSTPGGNREANWLPSPGPDAPDRRFTLVMRLYAPERKVLQGQWAPPALVKQ